MQPDGAVSSLTFRRRLAIVSLVSPSSATLLVGLDWIGWKDGLETEGWTDGWTSTYPTTGVLLLTWET